MNAMHLIYQYPLRFAISWLCFVSVLFCLPGSAFPSAGWMGDLQADKWIHVGIFSLLCFFWGIAFDAYGGKKAVVLWTIALAYGFLVEVVQDQFVTNRSFDLWDVAADAVGAVAGIAATRFIQAYKK